MKLFLSKQIKVNGKIKFKSLPIIKIRKLFGYYWIKTKIKENK